MQTPTFPERQKRPGVCYAVSTSGIELPIIDVTHPAFALTVSDAEQRAHIALFMQGENPLVGLLMRLPPAARRALTRLSFRGSVLAQDIVRADGSFLSGMGTYLMKLGPENLGSAYAKPIDRKIAASLPPMTLRWRLQDMAQLLADALLAAPDDGARTPIHLLNIAGGPAIDSLNALLVARRARPGWLDGRAIVVTVLDGDLDGPTFGERALAAWRAPGTPLHGLDVTSRRIPYDWRRPEELRPLLREVRSGNARIVASSEGGLFEYGTDADIVANLEVLRSELPADFAMVGSVTRNDAVMDRFRRASTAALHPRGLAAFRALAGGAGFTVGAVIERPFSDHLTVTPTRA